MSNDQEFLSSYNILDSDYLPEPKLVFSLEIMSWQYTIDFSNSKIQAGLTVNFSKIFQKC